MCTSMYLNSYMSLGGSSIKQSTIPADRGSLKATGAAHLRLAAHVGLAPLGLCLQKLQGAS